MYMVLIHLGINQNHHVLDVIIYQSSGCTVRKTRLLEYHMTSRSFLSKLGALNYLMVSLLIFALESGQDQL